MKNKILVLAATMILGVSSIAFNSFATNADNQAKQEFKKGERPERPENEIFGKITAISENSVTISLAGMKKPEDLQESFEKGKDLEKAKDFGKKDDKDNKKDNKPEERKELTEEQKAEMKKKMEEMFTLTGEIKTIDISKADFNAFGRGPRGGKINGNDGKAKNDAKHDEKDKQKEEKTYKDYQVGDYIFIELESKDSNKAKSVRSFFWR